VLRGPIAAILSAAVLASCAASRGAGAELATRRAERLGLQGAERDAFTREVAACVRRERARDGAARVPTSTLSVGVSGEASGTSAGGLAAVGVMATALAAGIAYRWWPGVRHRDSRTAEPSGVAARSPAPATVAADPPRTAADAVGSHAPSGIAGAALADAPDTIVDACLETVAARWQAERSAAPR
jgi:hypothetical protein